MSFSHRWSFLILLFASVALGQQNQNAIESASMNVFPPPDFYLDIHFTNSLDDPAKDLVTSNVTIVTSPAILSVPLVVGNVSRLPGTRKAARVTFTSANPTTINSVQVCFLQLTFVEASGAKQQASNVCGAAQIIDPRNVVTFRDQLLQSLQQVAKTSDEKNVFASGFVTTSSFGTQGGVDLNLNSNDLGIPGMTAFLHAKKASTAGGDPKNFEVGTNFRNAYVFGGSTIDLMKKDLDVLELSPDETKRALANADLNKLQGQMRHRLLAAVLVDFAGKLEGGATEFNVANYVGDGEVSLQSRTKTLLGSTHGYWKFRLLPMGIEGGKNIQTDSAASSASGMTEDFVLRYKGGGTLSFYYDNPESILPFKRIQLDFETAQRYLFKKENELLAPNTTPVMRDGYHPWYQTDVKVYFSEAASGRYGVRLSYNSGTLPPEFAHTRSFQFGFVYETADDNKKKTP